MKSFLLQFVLSFNPPLLIAILEGFYPTCLLYVMALINIVMMSMYTVSLRVDVIFDNR
jgi:hypothetical protein